MHARWPPEVEDNVDGRAGGSCDVEEQDGVPVLL
jgi:hypothetical protein